MPNLWETAEHAHGYLQRADSIPHRGEAEAVLLDFIPERTTRFLDLGSGAGRLLKLVRSVRPHASAVALDFSPAMLQALRENFAGDDSVEVIEHNFERPLPDLGKFDLAVSSLAIHHLPNERKRSLYEEVYARLTPGGVFLNFDHIAPASPALHEFYLGKLNMPGLVDDPSNILLDFEVQLRWLREIGFTEVDAYWKWLELALMGGRKPG